MHELQKCPSTANSVTKTVPSSFQNDILLRVEAVEEDRMEVKVEEDKVKLKMEMKMEVGEAKVE
ncbi:hypothetical protein DEO72_LG7g343 [Vigna unguiculata]|uniref:Uncharacterized protein n=1 Tax=Vigna unguiculata TaxID=3917 RepID=A0A4D6MH33_VIGUN|nr:hypothetical protein DEO72_LG7g343 [Vigna unguiculata]